MTKHLTLLGHRMTRIFPIFLFIGLAYWSCEEEVDEDTTPPTVTITFPQNNSSVFEIVSITCISSDNEGVEKVELWVNGVTTGLTDNSEPYSFDWNTTLLDNGNYTITIRSYDTNENTTDSEPVVLTVDNSLSVPQGGNITSVTYTTTEMMVEWEESSDGDFKDYKLLYSDTETGDRDTLETYTDILTTSYTITEFDPLIENWFWVQVTDTLGFSRIGTGLSNSIDSEPYPVNVTVVNYDLETMDITWEDYVPNMNRINQMNINTRSTVINDFFSYELLHSESEDGTYTSVVVITDQSTTSFSITEFDPTQENWFKIKVTDYWGLHSTGTGLSNDIDSPPTLAEISPILYYNGFQIKWLQNNDHDFKSYKLYESINEEMTNPILIYETTEKLDTNYVINNINENKYYQIICEDYWGLESTSNIEVLYTEVELWGQYYSVLNTYELILNNSGLFGPIPQEIGYLTNLTDLNLYWNQLTGSIPSELGYLTNLEMLSLGENELTGSIPPELGNLTNLIELILRKNQLSGNIPSEIGSLTNLVFLDLYGNELMGEIPPELENLNNLEKLYLYNNQLSGMIPSEIGNLTYLTSLKLSGNQLSGEIPLDIGNLTNLTSLYLNNNLLSGIIPETICNLDWGNLPYYSFSNNQLCPPYPSCIYTVGNQDLSNCDGMIEIWGDLYSIEYTTELNLSNNGLTDSIPPELGILTNLTALDLGYNELTGSIPPELGALTNLTYFNLGYNELTGSIPQEIGYLTNLTSLSLENNQLTGLIPPEIGNLTNLYNLNLEQNQLSGLVPDEICDQGDDWPRLEYNQLCPPYPSCIENSIGEQDTSDCP